jgi:hypothetical protein
MNRGYELLAETGSDAWQLRIIPAAACYTGAGMATAGVRALFLPQNLTLPVPLQEWPPF